MGLIHVLSEVPEDEPKCLINFTNPLLDTTKPFTIKLLRIFTKANDNLKKNIPVKVIVKDSPFLVYTNFTIPVETKSVGLKSLSFQDSTFCTPNSFIYSMLDGSFFS